MQPLLQIENLNVRYGSKRAVDDISLTLPTGRITGLLGANGAGKTSLMQAVLGLIAFEGRIDVLGCDPRKAREAMLRDVCYIPDVAILPPWASADELIRLMQGLHPRFDANRARTLLARTKIKGSDRVKTLSRGMVVQLHLALICAIDAKLMILDEPTLGLDIPSRKAFYDLLLTDWCTAERSVLIATHQVDEVENLLSHVLMIHDGQLILDSSMEDIATRFAGLRYDASHAGTIAAANPLYRFRQMGGECAIFNGGMPGELAGLGQPFLPQLSDLFVALNPSAHQEEQEHANV